MFDDQAFSVRNVTNLQLKDPETRAEFQKLYSHFNSERSRVIEFALKIENSLTIVILHAVVGKDYSRHRLLRTLVFEAESCSFMQLRKMLSLIFEQFKNEIDVITEEESNKLRRQLNDVILFRNMFAHGHVLVDASTGEVLITYYHGGPKETVITDELVTDFVEKCKTIDNSLKKLNDFFRETRLEY